MDQAFFESDGNEEILRDVLEKLICMHHRLGHQLIAVQSVCAYLIAEHCRGQDDPIGSVHDAVALLSGTGIAVADNCRASSSSMNFDTRGATEVFERIGTMAEQSVRSLVQTEIRSRGS